MRLLTMYEIRRCKNKDALDYVTTGAGSPAFIGKVRRPVKSHLAFLDTLVCLFLERNKNSADRAIVD